MRHTSILVVAVAAAATLGLMAVTQSATNAQDPPSGQERFVVFETLGREN